MLINWLTLKGFMRNILLLFVTTLLPFISIAQTFQKKVFSVDDGLVSHLIKATEFDSLGYLWIGTDEGLVRYDGRKFESYPSATPSRFIKRIQVVNDELLVISDLGITKINPEVDSVHFEQVLPGSRALNDTTIWYPKDIYSQRIGTTWISEPGSVVKIVDGKLKRYMFSSSELSSSFFRSFSFFEFNYNLYVLSYTGSLYMYNVNFDRFDLVEYSYDKALSEVYKVKVMGSSILVGDVNGIHNIDLISTSPKASFISNFGLSSISIIEEYKPGELILGDFGQSLLIVRYPDFKVLRREEVFRSNNVTVTPELNIWVSSDEGLILLKRNFFNQIGDKNHYIESITVVDSTVYYCHKDAVIAVNKKNNNFSEETIISGPNNYFLFLKEHNDDLWISNKWKLEQLRDHEKVNEIDLSYRGLFIFNFEFDKKGHLWICQDNVPGLLKIDSDHNFLEYQSDKGLDTRVLIVKEINGQLYAGGSGRSNYLYVYDEQTDGFKNISLPVDIQSESNLEVNDIVGRGDTLWLASTVGIFKYFNEKIEKIDIADFSSLPVKSLELEKGYMWFSNTFGVIRMDLTTNDYILFDENAGLSSRAGNSHALKIDAEGTKLIGTARGLSYSVDENESFHDTRQPILSYFEIDTKRVSSEKLSNIKIPNSSFVEFSFLSLTLPGQSLEYQIKDIRNDDWVNLGTSNFFQLPNSEQGDYSYLVRAKQKGNYNWSSSLAIQFSVDYPFYWKWWFITIVLLLLLSLLYLAYKINNLRIKRTSDKLNAIVDERTEQLLKANNNLVQTNKELDMFVYSASHDLKAPLASLKGLLNLYDNEGDQSGKNHLVDMMKINVSKLDDFIGEVLDYSKNSRTELTYEIIDFDQLISDILTSYQYMDNTDRVKVNIDITSDTYKSDKNRLRIILNNLISNSIRYSDSSKEHSYLNISVKKENKIITIRIEDNGLGIEKEHLKKVFDMFYRANDQSVGSGLGLYIVKEAINALSGKIELQSESGIGSKFSVHIPEKR